jgi:hypothetical protein
MIDRHCNLGEGANTWFDKDAPRLGATAPPSYNDV